MGSPLHWRHAQSARRRHLKADGNPSPAWYHYRSHSRLAPSQWETSLQSNAVSHRLGENLKSALYYNQGYVDSLAPVRCGLNLYISSFQIQTKDIYLEHFLWNCPQLNTYDITGRQTTLVQVIAWCRQATSHYTNQCWPTSLSPLGVTRQHTTHNTQHNSTQYDSADDAFNVFFSKEKF